MIAETKCAKCTVCGKELKSTSSYNLKRHIINSHETLAKEKGVLFNENDKPPNKKCKNIEVAIDKNVYIQGCVKLTTTHNYPLKLIDCDGFRDIVSPTESKLGIKINSKNIKDRIAETANKIRQEIKLEVEKKNGEC